MRIIGYNNKTKGFTLIELLVVVAIIGLLAAVVMVSMQGARSRARDARRLSDVRAIMTALEIYYNENSGYPDQGSANADPTASSVGPTGNANTEWRDYLAVWPTAPNPPDGTCASGGASVITTSTNQYTYWGRNAADSASDTTDPAFYQITFCMGAAVNNYPAGELKATPQGIFAN